MLLHIKSNISKLKEGGNANILFFLTQSPLPLPPLFALSKQYTEFSVHRMEGKGSSDNQSQIPSFSLSPSKGKHTHPKIKHRRQKKKEKGSFQEVKKTSKTLSTQAIFFSEQSISTKFFLNVDPHPPQIVFCSIGLSWSEVPLSFFLKRERRGRGAWYKFMHFFSPQGRLMGCSPGDNGKRLLCV